MEEKFITIFYSKQTGRIAVYCITDFPQNMDYFGENKVDFELIYDFLVFGYSVDLENVIRNKDMFVIDLETKQIVQKSFNLDIKPY